MPYGEAQRYVGMYRAQERALAAQEKLLEDQAAIVALLDKYDVTNEKRLSADQASGIAEVYGRWRMHLLYIDLWAKLCAAEYEAFLEGKPEPREMGEKL